MLNGKKILFLLPSLEMGGSERQALMLAEYLAAHHDVQVEIWGVSGRGLLVAECERLGFSWQVMDLRWPGRGVDRLRALAALAWKLRSAKPYIILPYTLLPSVACVLSRAGRWVSWNQRDISAIEWGRSGSAGRFAACGSSSTVGTWGYAADVCSPERVGCPERGRHPRASAWSGSLATGTGLRRCRFDGGHGGQPASTESSC
jgi:hypothetical protein